MADPSGGRNTIDFPTHPLGSTLRAAISGGGLASNVPPSPAPAARRRPSVVPTSLFSNTGRPPLSRPPGRPPPSATSSSSSSSSSSALQISLGGQPPSSAAPPRRRQSTAAATNVVAAGAFPPAQPRALSQRSKFQLEARYGQCQENVPAGQLYEAGVVSDVPFRDEFFYQARKSMQWYPNDRANTAAYITFHDAPPNITRTKDQVKQLPFPDQYQTFDGMFVYYVNEQPVLSFYYKLLGQEGRRRAFIAHTMRWNAEKTQRGAVPARLAAIEDVAAPELLGYAIETLFIAEDAPLDAIAVDVFALPRFNYWMWCIGWRPEFLVSSTPFAVGVHEQTFTSSGPAAGRDVHYITNTLTVVYLAPEASVSSSSSFSSSSSSSFAPLPPQVAPILPPALPTAMTQQQAVWLAASAAAAAAGGR